VLSPRNQQVSLVEVPDYATQGLLLEECGENQCDSALDFLVGLFDDSSQFVTFVSHGQRHHEVAALRFVQQPRI
jgi:hypothetical protein